MKKALIAGAASTIALAAMPFAGVFAVSEPSQIVVDNVEITVNPGCTMTRETAYADNTAEYGYTRSRTVTNENDEPAQGDTPTSEPTANNTFNYEYTLTNTVNFGTIEPGLVKEKSGQPVTITCSGESTTTAKTWTLRARGGNTYTTPTTAGAFTPTASSLVNITTGETPTVDAMIPSQDTGGLDGSDSEWAFKIASVTGLTNAGTFSIATGYDSYIAVPAADAAIATMTYGDNANVYGFTPSYKISVDETQAAGEYKGSVIYTIVETPGA